ncbi:hypothetical protein [Kordiimonas pumila]|uniref:Lipoprotein SmpA/OmlA domain-containing protein n=1 Tax=Kordiimonas pumila TaxID=2161677 RepID=A0ABV7D4S5_9PROT|nr:hypothetical protein [Kordiimonas pumila]
MRYSLLLCAVALSACSATTSPPPATQQPPAAPVVTPKPTKVAPPVTPQTNALSLKGLNPREVQDIAGEPSLVRRDNNVQVMLYETNSCVLEIVFYEPAPEAHFEAKHVNARTRSGESTNADKCFALVLASEQ